MIYHPHCPKDEKYCLNYKQSDTMSFMNKRTCFLSLFFSPVGQTANWAVNLKAFLADFFLTKNSTVIYPHPPFMLAV